MRVTPLALLALAGCTLVGCNDFPAPNSEDESESGTSTATDSTDSTGSSETATDSTGSSETATDTTGGGVDPILDAEDFGCILDWPKVHRFRVTNVLGDVDATLAVANSGVGGDYPVGSLIQLIPTEAMVKRAPGFAPQAHDWEFFSLSVSADGTEILDRGSDQVVNAFGGNCFDCHAKAAPQWDFVCEQDHGCDPLPFTEEQITAVQNADPRCR
ncbi:hypothetical protein ACNOYE_26600 [Nannocystaceae bacterium ST9]